MSDILLLLDEVLSDYRNANKWDDARFEAIKQLANTKVGDVGQDFIRRLAEINGFVCQLPVNSQGKNTRVSSWDLAIDSVRFEIKTATEDTNNAYQFNHIRHHRVYDAVLCLAISPDNIFFGVWSKAQIAVGEAGKLVSMDKGSSATFKLTKRAATLHDISDFAEIMGTFIKGATR